MNVQLMLADYSSFDKEMYKVGRCPALSFCLITPILSISIALIVVSQSQVKSQNNRHKFFNSKVYPLDFTTSGLYLDSSERGKVLRDNAQNVSYTPQVQPSFAREMT